MYLAREHLRDTYFYEFCFQLSTESRNNIMDFVASHKISASKFRMMGGEFL